MSVYRQRLGKRMAGYAAATLTVGALLLPGVAAASGLLGRVATNRSHTRTASHTFIPSCQRYDVFGSAGMLAVQINPRSHRLQWGIYMYTFVNHFGAWTVDVFVNGKRKDRKQQIYEPHGSLPRSKAVHGGIFNISAIMTNYTGTYRNVPNLCQIP